MKKLYRVRLFRLMDKVTSSKYEVYGYGSIIVSNNKKECREYFYELDIPIVDSNLEHDEKNYIPMNLVTIPTKDFKGDYIVLSEDFSEKNRVKTKEDLREYVSLRNNYTLDMVRRLKEFENTEKGVVYGKNIRRS